MAGTLAAGAWDRDTCDPFDEHSGPADAPASKERPARHRTSEAELPWLAARRAWALHDGAGADAVGGGRAAAEPGAFEPDRRADRKSVVSGKSVSVRVDLGGRRIIKKKKI